MTMETRKLGASDLAVSIAGFGTMTLGAAVAPQLAARLLDVAVDCGVNFIDCAEIYPAPAHAETFGLSESLVGRWLSARGRRDELVIATKVCGPAAYVPWVRDGATTYTDADLGRAVDGSLARLRVERIDLLQLHWPERATNFFGVRGFKPPRDERPFDIDKTLDALGRLVATGKVRAVGVCNETPWGVMRYLATEDAGGGGGRPRLAAVQQPYHLLNRAVESGMTEIAWRESLGLLAYSPLANGLLSGKYHDGSARAEDRLNASNHYRRYHGQNVMTATARYLDIAADAGLAGHELALAWLASKPAVASVIIGATNEHQLRSNLAALRKTLPREVEHAIDAVHEENPNPCP